MEVDSLDKSFRMQVIFWLNLNNPIHEMLADYIADLKASRMFAPTIRDALLLVRDLRNGRLCELERQFPGVVEFIKANGADGGDNGDDGLARRIDMLESAVLAGRAEVLMKPLPEADAIIEGAADSAADSAADLIEVTANGKPSSEELGSLFMEERGNLFS